MRDQTVVRIGLGIRIFAAVCLLLLIGPWIVGPIRASLMRKRLLCRTDHRALLQAGREVLRQGAHDPQASTGQAGNGSEPSHEAMQLPKVIRDLRARYVGVSDGYLRIEMHGGMTHFGFHIYPEDFQEPFPDFRYGDHKLLDGLWYYDDEYKRSDYRE